MIFKITKFNKLIALKIIYKINIINHKLKTLKKMKMNKEKKLKKIIKQIIFKKYQNLKIKLLKKFKRCNQDKNLKVRN